MSKDDVIRIRQAVIQAHAIGAEEIVENLQPVLAAYETDFAACQKSTSENGLEGYCEACCPQHAACMAAGNWYSDTGIQPGRS
jgi:hypothetical protein